MRAQHDPSLTKVSESRTINSEGNIIYSNINISNYYFPLAEGKNKNRDEKEAYNITFARIHRRAQTRESTFYSPLEKWNSPPLKKASVERLKKGCI